MNTQKLLENIEKFGKLTVTYNSTKGYYTAKVVSKRYSISSGYGEFCIEKALERLWNIIERSLADITILHSA